MSQKTAQKKLMMMAKTYGQKGLGTYSKMIHDNKKMSTFGC